MARKGHERYRRWEQRNNPYRTGPLMVSVDGTGTPDEVERDSWSIVEELIR